MCHGIVPKTDFVDIRCGIAKQSSNGLYKRLFGLNEVICIDVVQLA